MPLLGRAFELAFEKHAGQTDKSGKPYILHPVAVAHRVEGGMAKVVALLHDVVEDTDCTIEHIAYNFGPVVSQAVDAVTKREGEAYKCYLKRVKRNEIAREVKIADVSHNLERIGDLSKDDQLRLADKYGEALSFLSGDAP